jgi:3-oxoacyl-[acyl-carrier protein] reductase
LCRACAQANRSPRQSGSLLKTPAGKDDRADMVVAMCRTETMTGQTVVIDAGRIFH